MLKLTKINFFIIFLIDINQICDTIILEVSKAPNKIIFINANIQLNNFNPLIRVIKNNNKADYTQHKKCIKFKHLLKM